MTNLRPNSSRWFGLSVVLVFGFLLGLSLAPLFAGNVSTRQQFYLGILGNIIAAFIVLPGFWCLNFLEIRFSQIRKFFGIRSNTTFLIFVGHLPHPNLRRGTAGVEELNEAHELRSNLQSSVPGLGDVYLLRRLRLMDVEVKIVVADVSHDYTRYLSASLLRSALEAQTVFLSRLKASFGHGWISVRKESRLIRGIWIRATGG
jgi:hypothetical protein